MTLLGSNYVGGGVSIIPLIIFFLKFNTQLLMLLCTHQAIFNLLQLIICLRPIILIFIIIYVIASFLKSISFTIQLTFIKSNFINFMGNQSSSEEFEFPQYLEILDQQHADQGYYKLRDQRTSCLCIGKTLTSNGKETIDDTEGLICEKLDNPSPFVTQLLEYNKSIKENYCSDQTLFHLLFKAPEKTLFEEIKIRKQNRRGFTDNEVDNMVTRTVKGLKYLYNVDHSHGKISTQAIQWPDVDNKVKLIDPWTMNIKDQKPNKICGFKNKSQTLGEQQQQHAIDLYEIGMIGIEMTGNYHPKYDFQRHKAAQNSNRKEQEKLRQKLQILCDRDEKKRFQIYKVLESQNMGTFNSFRTKQPNLQTQQTFPPSIFIEKPAAKTNPILQNIIPQSRTGSIYHNEVPPMKINYIQTPTTQNTSTLPHISPYSNRQESSNNNKFNNQTVSQNFNKNKITFSDKQTTIDSKAQIQQRPLGDFPITIPRNASISVSPIKQNLKKTNKPRNQPIPSPFNDRSHSNFMNRSLEKKQPLSSFTASPFNSPNDRSHSNFMNHSLEKNSVNNSINIHSNNSHKISFNQQKYESPQFPNHSLSQYNSFNSKNYAVSSQQTPTFNDLMAPTLYQPTNSFNFNSFDLKKPWDTQSKQKQSSPIQEYKESYDNSGFVEQLQGMKKISDNVSPQKNKLSTEFESPNKINPVEEQSSEKLLSNDDSSLKVTHQDGSYNNQESFIDQNQRNIVVIPELSESGNSGLADEDREYVLEEYQNGSRYEGYKSNNMRNGKGKFFYQQGSFYDGDWKNNNMHGNGKLYYSNKKLAYDGQWYMDQFHGKGKVYNDEPEKLESPFDYTNFQNLDERWDYYDGTLVSDEKQGYGILVLSNGQKYEGEFHNDNVHGRGKFYTQTGEIIQGIWHNAILQKRL